MVECKLCKKNIKFHKNLKAHLIKCQKKHETANPKQFQCDICKKSFSKKRYKAEHIRNVHCRKTMVQCEFCLKKYKSRKYLKSHILKFHKEKNPNYYCMVCSKSFVSRNQYIEHLESHKSSSKNFFLYKHALNNKCRVFRREFGLDEVKSVENLFHSNREEMEEILSSNLTTDKHLKTGLVLCTEFIQIDGQQQIVDSVQVPIRAPYFQINNFHDISQGIEMSESDLINGIENFQSLKSDWVFYQVINIDLEICTLNPLSGRYSEIPISIDSMKDIYSSKKFSLEGKSVGEKNSCFLNAVALYFVRKMLVDVPEHLESFFIQDFVENRLNVNTDLPVKLSSIPKFERDNAHLNIKVNVLHCEDKNVIYPLRVNREDEQCNIVNLLLYPIYSDSEADFMNSIRSKKNHEQIEVSEKRFQNEEEEKEFNYHYFLINDLNEFLNNGQRNKKFFCVNCLQGFYSESCLTLHQEHCFEFECQKIFMPKNHEAKLSFRDHLKKFPVYFTIFFDFETILEKSESTVLDKCDQCIKNEISVCQHENRSLNNHKPISYCLIVVDIHDKVFFKKLMLDSIVCRIFGQHYLI